jgi:hypothetical protein
MSSSRVTAKSSSGVVTLQALASRRIAYRIRCEHRDHTKAAYCLIVDSHPSHGVSGRA